jgi:hypothetical protein
MLSPSFVTFSVGLVPWQRLEMKRYEAKRYKSITWRRSSFCAQGECAEIANRDGLILLRSSLAPREVVAYTPAGFRALQLRIKAGEFDHLA